MHATNYGFYLENENAPGLRWTWCDDVTRSIRHTGWFADNFEDEKIRGMVFRLPKSRGFLAGWSYGAGMLSVIDVSFVYDDETSAAFAADSMAEFAAEEARDFAAEQERELENENEGEN